MSWLFSQALVEAYSEASYLAGEQSAPLSGSHTQQAYCAPDKMTGFSRLSQFGMTFKPFVADRGEELLTLFREDFHVKTSVQSEKVQESKEIAAECGDKWRASFTKYDLNTHSWRTHQCSLLGGLDEFLETWPQWGLMRDGECWEQETLAHHTKGTESGSWLPTPLTSDYKKITKNKEYHLKRNFDLPNKLVQIGHPPSKNGGWGWFHPVLSESMMGWPTGWTELKPLAMDKSHSVQQQHGES
jgi:hypothetical protein